MHHAGAERARKDAVETTRRDQEGGVATRVTFVTWAFDPS